MGYQAPVFDDGVAHDLRAPLRGIVGFSNVLLEDYDEKLDDPGKAALRVIVRNAKHMGCLIDGLEALAAVSHAPCDPVRVDFTEMFRASASALGAAHPMRRVRVTVQPDVAAWIDPPLGRALVEILLGNAWKFTSKVADAHIDVGVEGAGAARTYFVRDDGAGFDMAHAARLFATFERLHSAGNFPGIGVGLAMARCIVERHDGRIWADATVGRGATLRFTLAEGGA